MVVKIVSAIIATILMFVFLAAPVVKLKEVDLGIVILIGFAMMVLDLWQSLKSRED
jgi:putative effector of murein hydrolase LrgA (UPF0299 family)